MSNSYRVLSGERKKMQEEGLMPLHWSTGSWQLFKNKYLYQAANPKEQYQRIASTLAAHTPDPQEWKDKFFDIMWKGWLSPSTPILANTGTNRGLPVSCAGSYIPDSIDGIYKAKHETAMLTKMGFGTAGYLGDVRPRGAQISVGGTSTGVMQVIEGFQRDMEYVAQGTARRGSWAGYLPIDHGDFNEVCTFLEQHPDGNNIGWNVSEEFIERLKSGDVEAVERYGKALKTKMVTGKGYFFFPDKAAAKRPLWYVDQGLDVKAPQLCVAPETLILTDKGYEIISELEGEYVNVWNGEEWSNVQVKKTGENQELVTVNTNSGFSIDCTPYHKFYIQESGRRDGKVIEVNASQLKVGDKLIKLETPVIEGDKVLNKPYENGFYSGDGCCVDGKARIYLYGEKRKLVDKFESKVQHYVQENYDREYFYVDGLKQKFFVPDASFRVKDRVDWFAGLLDSDGCLTTNGKSQTLQIASTQQGFLESVQLMLQTLGIQSKVVMAREAGVYELPANDGTGKLGDFECKKAVRLLVNGMGIVRLLELGMETFRLQPTGHIPNRDAAAFVKVESVVWAGRRDDTFCFTEPKRHMGVFNGLLTGQCNEIMLHSSKDFTYTCVLASMNIELFDEWKDTDAVFVATVFLDCVCQEFIERAKNIPGLEKAVAFTKNSRALGLGQCGLHSYFQKKMIAFESLEAHMQNLQIAKYIQNEAIKASEWLASVWGEPKWMKGYGRANTHLIAIAPTKSTALIMGGVSEGISPDTAMVYTQKSAGGEVDRVNPYLLKLMKEKGVYSKANVESIRDKMGSVQHVDWLTDEEKLVFRTAFEINQHTILRMAASRGKYVDQWMSLNLFFAAGEDESYINAVHKEAFLNPDILGLYYVYSMAGIQASKDECVACQ